MKLVIGFLWLTAQAQAQVFSGCVFKTSTSNMAHYRDYTETYTCAEGEVTLQGQWGTSRQGPFEYDTQLERAPLDARYVGYDPPRYGKWKKTRYGLELVGPDEAQIVEEPRP